MQVCPCLCLVLRQLVCPVIDAQVLGLLQTRELSVEILDLLCQRKLIAFSCEVPIFAALMALDVFFAQVALVHCTLVTGIIVVVISIRLLIVAATRFP
jgi:hypothetical protein